MPVCGSANPWHLGCERMVENNRILEENLSEYSQKSKISKKWLRSKIAANRAGFFSHYHFHALQSNLRLYCTKPINSSAELITIYALRLSLETFRTDYETCKYFICWKEQRKFKCSRTFTFAIHTHNRKMFASRWHASLSPEQIG